MTWVSNLADELLIPKKKRTATLVPDDKPSTKYHDGVIVRSEANYLHLLVANKGAFVIANRYRASSKANKTHGCASPLFSAPI